MLPKYRDKHEDYWRSTFERLPGYEQYLDFHPANYVERWRSFEPLVELSGARRDLVASFKRRMPVIVMTGIWCGDCARQGPIFHAIEKAAPVIEFRFAENHAAENSELRELLRINGAERVPELVMLNEDFQEIQRFGEKHLSVYRRKAKTELGPACDAGLLPPPGEELQTEIGEWVDTFERVQLLLRLAPQFRERYKD